MQDVTRLFRLRDERRDPEKNDETVYRAPQRDSGRPHAPFDARQFFLERFRCIRPALERHPSLGVLVLAFDEHPEPLAEAWMEASLDRPRALIVGRHSVCPIMMPAQNMGISLRHLAIVAQATSLTEVRIRMVDLGTSIGFADEAGRTLEAAAFDGPMFFSIAGIRFVVLITGLEAPLEDASAAYRAIPERVLVDERLHQARIGARQAEAVEGATLVKALAGPVFATARLTSEGEPPAGRLALVGGGFGVERDVSRQALDRGILVGRYSRCDVRTGSDSNNISRVHALLLRERGALWLIDTASTNGTWKEGREVAVSRVLDGDTFGFGEDALMCISWRTAEDGPGCR